MEWATTRQRTPFGTTFRNHCVPWRSNCALNCLTVKIFSEASAWDVLGPTPRSFITSLNSGTSRGVVGNPGFWNDSGTGTSGFLNDKFIRRLTVMGDVGGFRVFVTSGLSNACAHNLLRASASSMATCALYVWLNSALYNMGCEYDLCPGKHLRNSRRVSISLTL